MGKLTPFVVTTFTVTRRLTRLKIYANLSIEAVLPGGYRFRLIQQPAAMEHVKRKEAYRDVQSRIPVKTSAWFTDDHASLFPHITASVSIWELQRCVKSSCQYGKSALGCCERSRFNHGNREDCAGFAEGLGAATHRGRFPWAP